MPNRGRTDDSALGVTRASARITAALLAALSLCGCPLPYKYSPEGYPGTSTGADPSTPDISASPFASYSCSDGAAGTIQGGGSATVSADSEVRFSSATVGAVIYYTKDGSAPDPRSPATSKYSPGAPCRISLTDLAPRTLRAIAIGPNMKPSRVSTFSIGFHSVKVAAPVLTPEDGEFQEAVTLRLSTETPGANIYYTLAYGVFGNTPSPAAPAPDQSGTYLYTGPIQLRGPSRNWAIAAVAVKDLMEDSDVVRSAYHVIYQITDVDVPDDIPLPIADVSGWGSRFNQGFRWGSSILGVFWTTTDGITWLVVYDEEMHQTNARSLGDDGTMIGFTISMNAGFPQLYIDALIGDDMVYTYYHELGFYVPL